MCQEAKTSEAAQSLPGVEGYEHHLTSTKRAAEEVDPANGSCWKNSLCRHQHTVLCHFGDSGWKRDRQDYAKRDEISLTMGESVYLEDSDEYALARSASIGLIAMLRPHVFTHYDLRHSCLWRTQANVLVCEILNWVCRELSKASKACGFWGSTSISKVRPCFQLSRRWSLKRDQLSIVKKGTSDAPDERERQIPRLWYIVKTSGECESNVEKSRATVRRPRLRYNLKNLGSTSNTTSEV